MYRGQPGALNEHMSDVFAIMCDQRVNHETTEMSDWLIGRTFWSGVDRGFAP